jgi:hypothetical protein
MEQQPTGFGFKSQYRNVASMLKSVQSGKLG